MNNYSLSFFMLFLPCAIFAMDNYKEYGDKYRMVIAHKNEPENKPELLAICKECSLAEGPESKTFFEKLSLFRFLIKETILFHADDNKIKKIRKLIDEEKEKWLPDFYVCEMEKCVMRPIS